MGASRAAIEGVARDERLETAQLAVDTHAYTDVSSISIWTNNDLPRQQRESMLGSVIRARVCPKSETAHRC